MSAPNSTVSEIPDFSTGKALISCIPLANPQLALDELIRFLDRLLASTLGTRVSFQLLEHARLPIIFIAGELAKRYLDKPIPLGDREENFFQQVTQLWLKMAKAYAHCAGENPPAPDKTRVELFATLLHRCIHFTGMAILEYQHARREISWGLWLELHRYYGTAEEWGISTQAIPNVFESSPQTSTTHCAATYTAFILSDMASSYNLSLHEQIMVRRWAMAWSPLTSLHSFTLGESLPPFVIDLGHDTALRPTAGSLTTDRLRCIDAAHLASRISQIRKQLKQRTPPSQLGLGDNCTSLQCSRLLEHLARQWSQNRAVRKYRRHPFSGMTRICSGFEEMHFFISGGEFQQPENTSVYSQQDFDRLSSFRFQEDPQQSLHFRQEKTSSNYKVDTWEVVNQSANGFCLVRGAGGRKMLLGQLLALCPHDSERFMLARAVWLMQENKGGLIAGVNALPGLPTAICIRHIEKPELYQRAFLLSAGAAHTEPSLILPTGWYRPGQIVEIFTQKTCLVRLKHLLESGSGFEHIGFENC